MKDKWSRIARGLFKGDGAKQQPKNSDAKNTKATQSGVKNNGNQKLSAENLSAALQQLASPSQSSAILKQRVKSLLQEIEKQDLFDSMFAELAQFDATLQTRLIRLFALSHQGIFTVVRLREKLLPRIQDDEGLKALDERFFNILDLWFDPAFLTIERKSHANLTPPMVAKLRAYQKVHAFENYAAFERRILSPDRRCYAFSHPAYPDEPLIYVEVALTDSVPSDIADLLSVNKVISPTGKANTATFCSISACHEGLTGIRFGEILIKEAVSAIQAELPQIRNFCTLSPMPGFRKWLEQQIKEQGDSLLTAPEAQELYNAQRYDKGNFRAALNFWDSATRSISQGNGFSMNMELAELMKALQAPLTRLGTYYLLNAKRSDGLPLDPVARFHLANGAHVHRVNFLGNGTEGGLKQSAGLMVNYIYDLPSVEDNIRRFHQNQEVALGKNLQNYAKRLKLTL